MDRERRLSNWLKGYQEFTEGTESPPIFHMWTGIGIVSAAAQRKIMMDADYFQVHTNQYIILVSPPGRSRKSTALRIGKSILKGVPDWGQDIYFSTQASSVPALVKQMSAIPTKEHQSLTLCGSELGTFLGKNPVEMTDFLVDIYDCEPDWDKQTVGRGLEKIPNPWFNLITATTPNWLGENLPKTATEGGFVSRTLFIFEDTRRRVAFPQMTPEQKVIKKHLIHDLACIARLKGTMTFADDDTKTFWKYWYEEVNVVPPHADQRVTGYYERKSSHVLKVAMALSLAEGDSLHVDRRDIETAIAILEEVEPGMRRAFSAVGKNIYSTDLERIKTQIMEAGTVSYKRLLSANIHSVEKSELDKLLEALEAMGDIERLKGSVFRIPEEAKNGRKESAILRLDKRTPAGDRGSDTSAAP